jgi:4-amino-4-deoxy-L-arabinose transferase-like glycosyltransferase
MNFKTIAVIIVFMLVLLLVAMLSFEKQIVHILMSVFPKEPDKTFGYFRDLVSMMSFELVWLILIISLTWFFVANPAVTAYFAGIERGLLRQSRFYVSAILIGFFLIAVFFAYVVLDQFPNSSDEYVYVFQAETLSEGKLWVDAHPLEVFFRFNHLAHKDGISVGRFPPGWPLILSIALFLGIPAILVNPILATITLFIFYKLAKKLYGNRVALLSMLLLAFTSFFVFNSASFFSHTLCQLCSVLFLYCMYVFLETEKAKYGVLAGVFLGMVLLTRYYTAILIFVPFFISLIVQHKLRSFQIFWWIGIGVLPCLVFLFWYNYAITGHPLTPVTVWAYEGEGLGFVKGHTFLKGIEHIVRRIIMFVYWCSPAVLFLYFYFLWEKIRKKSELFVTPEDYLLVIFIVGYLFYYEIGGNQYGPRFYYEALPFVIVFIVFRIFQQNDWTKPLFYAALICAIVKLPVIGYHEHLVVKERQDIYRQVREQNIHRAVVLIASSTSVIRPMPIGDLTRNDKQYKNDVLYARDFDQQDLNPQLFEYYKDRSFYRYVRDPEKSTGELIRIR